MAEGQGSWPRRCGAGRGKIPLNAPTSLAVAAVAVLCAAAPEEKVALSHATALAWRSGAMVDIGDAPPPPRPARPARPLLMAPRDMPRRRAGGSLAGRIALLHALAHIELNAIDLAWDLIARFTGEDLPRAFYDEWVTVADEEATHHALIAARLRELGAAYGDLPAHDGLWEAAQVTAHDLLARLAVVPLVLEARGLDVTPDMIARLRRFGDAESAAALAIVYRDEIGHVATGRRWFDQLCARRGLEPGPTYLALVERHFRGRLKPPFNRVGREAAGLPEPFYAPLAQSE
ncbi:MAG TPA: ferritin-like domain-containing protein [Stellaceae bacterium]|nr:ferritin-like domain-containing protein [Stellaceae bacterium]